MAEWVEGVDVSAWQGDIRPEQWQALYNAGQRVAVVGSWHGYGVNPYAEANLVRAADAGFATATYVALNQRSGTAAVDAGREACGDAWKGLAFCAIDCEIDGISRVTITDAVSRVCALGQRPVLYTAYWWWHGHIGDPRWFSDLPLWNAYYDSDSDIDFASLPYGGWTVDKVIGEQFAGTVQLAGVTVDRNSFRKDFVFPEEADMPDEELRRWQTVEALFLRAASYAAQGKPLPAELAAQIKFLLGA